MKKKKQIVWMAYDRTNKTYLPHIWGKTEDAVRDGMASYYSNQIPDCEVVEVTIEGIVT